MNKTYLIKKNDGVIAIQFFIALLCLIPILLISYFFLDKPVAYFVNQLHLPFNHLLVAYTKIKPFVYLSSIIGMIIYFFFHKKIQSKTFNKRLLVYSLSIILANAFKDILKFGFGRDWPKTWYHHNLSLIHDHAYKCNWLHGSPGYSSFPSGHMTVMTAAMGVLCIYIPKLRWLWISIIIFMAFSLLFLDYHFLSDIIAGSFLGITTALCVNKEIQ